MDGKNIITQVKLAPCEAALGLKADVPTLDGMVKMTIPAGAQNGQKMRLKGKGFPAKKNAGDLLVELQIVMPEKINDAEKKLFEKLAKVSDFNPRQ